MNSTGSICIAGVVVLESPRAVDPQKGTRHVVFDSSFCIIQGSETVTMSLLRYFASTEMATEIQKMAEKPFQKAFVVANIASPTPNSVSSALLTSGYELSDYAFVGDIHQLIPIEGDSGVDMENSPYITVTGTVSTFDANAHTFTMTPSQYIVLTHSSLPFPIHARFANWDNKKRWGPDGPKVTIGTTITFGGFLERAVCERNIDRRLEFADIEVTNIAYFGTRTNLTASPTRSESHVSGTRRQWNWDSLRKPSVPSQSSTTVTSKTLGKRKECEDSELDENKASTSKTHKKRMQSEELNENENKREDTVDE